MAVARRIATALRKAASYLNPVYSTVGGWVTVFETTTGSWQQDVEAEQSSVSANWSVFACVTLIAGDIATKAADVQIGFLDRFTGSLVIYGSVGAVEESLRHVVEVLARELHYSPCPLTRT